MMNFFCHVKYSYLGYQVEIFKAKFGLGHRFHDLKYFEVGIFFQNP